MFYGYYKKGSDGLTRKSKVHIFINHAFTLCQSSFYTGGGRELVNLGKITNPNLNIPHSDICGNCTRC